MPFYRRLTERAAHNNRVQLIAVFPTEAAEARRYLGDYGVQLNNVRQLSLSSINVSGTPTIVLFNRRGTVEHVWVGQLSVDKEAEVLASL